MQEFLRKNTVTLLIVLATIILAGVAIFTAIRLYQTRQGTVTPNLPSSQPAAAINTACQTLSFTISTPTPSPTPTITPSPTPVPQCGSSCTTPSDCPIGMTCSSGLCRRTSCTSAVNCICATATPSPSPTPTITPSPTPVPQCGSSCTTNANCISGMSCSGGICRNTSCTSSANCICATATPTPTPTPSPTPSPIAVVPTPSPIPSLPTSGDTTPTILGISAGLIMLVVGAIIIL
jgi:hypothetical protein